MLVINDYSPYRPSPAKAKVIEDSARTSNNAYSYTGTVRTVGSGKTHATLTAAYAACSSGDIIEVYGTIDLTAEAGGYWLINTAKSVLVRGSTSNPSDTVLSKAGGASGFAVRVRVNSGIVFKDLTFYTNQNAANFYNDADEANRSMICDNCRFIQEGTGASSTWMDLSGAAAAQTRYFEFKNCYFERVVSGASIPLNIILPSANNTFLFTGCSFNCNGSTLRVHQTFNGSFIMYNCNFTQRSSNVCVQFGYDTTIPTATIGLVDFRGNKIKFLTGYCQHGVLFGRGTDIVKCYNNEVYMYSCNDALAIGYVLKTTTTNVGDSLFKGNFAYAPRPLYIKGGSKMTISKNIFVGNYSDGNIWESFGFTNHKSGADEVLSRSNVITENYFVSGDHGVHIYNTGAAESDIDSFKTCTLRDNIYATVADRYLYTDSGTAYYTFSNRNSFYGATDNDVNLKKLNSFISTNFS